MKSNEPQKQEQYFAELFSGAKTKLLPFLKPNLAVEHFKKEHGVNLMSVRRYGITPGLVFLA